MHPEQGVSGRRADPHPAARRRQVLRQELPLLRRPARRRRLGGQRPVEPARGAGQARRQGVPDGLRRRRQDLRARGRRHGRPAQHGHHHALLARSGLLRLADASTSPRLKHVLRAKAVLCPGLHVAFRSDEKPADDEDWFYEEGLADYLLDELGRRSWLPRGAVRRPPRGQRGGGRLGGGLARRGGRQPVAGELRQPDPDAAGRHARQRSAQRV